jgi:predicted enzyme related to lactoylglutathione lyase
LEPADMTGPDWPRPVVHWEIVARDPERLAVFYRRLCNWEIGDGPIMQVPAGIGAPEPGPAGHFRQGDRTGVTLYVQVRNLRASLALAAELGGTVTMEPFDVPDGPTLAAVEDPEGNPLVLVQQ